MFKNLVLGTYSIKFMNPTGYLFTLQSKGNDIEKDSDANIVSGITNQIVLNPGQVENGIDAGFRKLHTSLSIDKSVDRTDFKSIGDKLTYKYKVTNTGEVKVNEIMVKDDKISNVSCPKNSLDIGESMECTADYLITSSDISAGKVSNIAYAIGKDLNKGDILSINDVVEIKIQSVNLPKTGTDNWLMSILHFFLK